MNVFSFSRLSLYEKCPYRFYLKYVEGYEEPVTLPLALGKAVHKAIEVKINGLDHESAIVEGFIEGEFHSEIDRNELSDLVSRVPVERLQGKTEVYFKLPLSDEKESPLLQGYIDLLTPFGQIMDWKTNRKTYPIIDNHQLALYAWAVSQLKGLEQVQGTLYFLRFRKESTHVFTKDDMERARNWALRLANEIKGKLDLLKELPDMKKELFPATPSANCSHCPFAVDCFRKFSPVSKMI